MRTTTESYIASLPDDKTPTPSSAAPSPDADDGDGEDGRSEEHEGEGELIDNAASTPPPRIPTPILQALQAIRHYKPPPELKTTYFLQETHTFWLLSLPSKCLEWGGEEATRLRREDGHYYWLTYDEGRLRHRHEAETQTPVKLIKKKKTQTLAVHSSTVKLFATEWDLYDTFRKVNIASRLAGRGGARSAPIATSGAPSTGRLSARTPATLARGSQALPDTPGTGPTTAASRTKGSGWARLAAATAREAANRTTIIRIGEQPASPRRRLLKNSQDLLESREFRLAATICERLLASNSYRRRQVRKLHHI